jgi:hypothetical protein
VWFQQDLATAHTTDDFLRALEGMFDDRIISCCGLWPACLQDLIHAAVIYEIIRRVKSTK